MAPSDAKLNDAVKGLNIKDLRAQLRGRGMSPGGTEEELRARLKEYMAATGNLSLLKYQPPGTPGGQASADESHLKNNYARPGGNQNVGNRISDRPSSRVLAPPGGKSQVTFGGDAAPAEPPNRASKASAVDASDLYARIQAQARSPLDSEEQGQGGWGGAVLPSPGYGQPGGGGGGGGGGGAGFYGGPPPMGAPGGGGYGGPAPGGAGYPEYGLQGPSIGERGRPPPVRVEGTPPYTPLMQQHGGGGGGGGGAGVYGGPGAVGGACGGGGGGAGYPAGPGGAGGAGAGGYGGPGAPGAEFGGGNAAYAPQGAGGGGGYGGAHQEVYQGGGGGQQYGQYGGQEQYRQQEEYIQQEQYGQGQYGQAQQYGQEEGARGGSSSGFANREARGRPPPPVPQGLSQVAFGEYRLPATERAMPHAPLAAPPPPAAGPSALELDNMFRGLQLQDLRTQCRTRGLNPAGGAESLRDKIKADMQQSGNYAIYK